MPEPQLDQTDTILLLLAAETSDSRQRFRCDGITRLEKLLFLVEKETNFREEQAQPFTFEPYHYGPYSAAVYDAIAFLKSMQLFPERQIDVSSGLDVGEQVEALDPDDLNQSNAYVERQLILTEDDKAVAKVLSTRISPAGKEALTKIEDLHGSMPLRQLLRYIYSRYPEYTERSRMKQAV